MFDTLSKAIKKLIHKSQPFNPKTIEDSFAHSISWDPIKSGGSNFKTHKLILINSQRLEFKPTLFAYFFGIIFCVVGAGGSFTFFTGIKNGKDDLLLIFPSLFSLLFLFIGPEFNSLMQLKRI